MQLLSRATGGCFVSCLTTDCLGPAFHFPHRSPLNYFLLLRALFRSIGGGKFETLYREFLPFLPVLLEYLNKLQGCVWAVCLCPAAMAWVNARVSQANLHKTDRRLFGRWAASLFACLLFHMSLVQRTPASPFTCLSIITLPLAPSLTLDIPFLSQECAPAAHAGSLCRAVPHRARSPVGFAAPPPLAHAAIGVGPLGMCAQKNQQDDSISYTWLAA